MGPHISTNHLAPDPDPLPPPTLSPPPPDPPTQLAVRDLARELVSIPSHENERAAGDFIERWLREETPADVTRDDAPDGGSVIGGQTPSSPAAKLPTQANRTPASTPSAAPATR